MKRIILQGKRHFDLLVGFAGSEFQPIDTFFNAFPALRHRNYRLYFAGHFISLVGTWLQMVAQGWLVLEMTNSAFWVGVVAAVSNVPTLLFSVFAGVIADRFSRRRLLLFTEAAAMLLSFVLGVLTVSGSLTIGSLILIVFLLGVLTALDLPARQTFTFEMVAKEHLASAIALNSAMFNGARVIGPALAGLLIAVVGIGGVFIINAFSFLAIIGVLLLIQERRRPREIHPHPIAALKEGIAYVFSHKTIRTILVFTAFGAMFSWSISSIMPVIAKDVFHQDAAGLGYMFSAMGIGAVCGTVLISAFSRRVSPHLFIFGGNALFAITTFLFGSTTDIRLGLLFLFLGGLGLLSQYVTMNATVQHLVEDRIRGRVISLHIFAFLGMLPLGSFLIGLFSQTFGVQTTIRLFALFVFCYGAYLFFNKRLEGAR